MPTSETLRAPMQLVPQGVHSQPGIPDLAASEIYPENDSEEWLMKMPVMIDSNPPTTVDAIATFERSRGIQLPPSYRDFLLVSNGGVPKLTRFPVAGRPNDPIESVQVFCGLGVRWPTTELSYALDLYRGAIPEGVVPFAVQDGGSFICFDLRNGYEQVVFWDHRHFWSTGEWRELDLYHVADSFEGFLELLRPE